MSQVQEGAQWCLHLPCTVLLAWRPAYGPRRWRDDGTLKLVPWSPCESSSSFCCRQPDRTWVVPLDRSPTALCLAVFVRPHDRHPHWAGEATCHAAFVETDQRFSSSLLGKMDSACCCCCCCSAAELTHIHSWRLRFTKWNVLCGWPTGGLSITCGFSFFFFSSAS